MYFRSFSFSKDMQQQMINFSNLTNFVALKGGRLKREQMLSGDMADIFSNLYLAHSVYNYHINFNSSKILTDYIIKKLLNENQRKINKIIDNLGNERFLLQHMKKNTFNITYDDERIIFNEIMNNKNIINEIQKNVHTDNNILGDMIEFNDLNKINIFDDNLNNKIINVGEYNNFY